MLRGIYKASFGYAIQLLIMSIIAISLKDLQHSLLLTNDLHLSRDRQTEFQWYQSSGVKLFSIRSLHTWQAVTKTELNMTFYTDRNITLFHACNCPILMYPSLPFHVGTLWMTSLPIQYQC